jgi:hypothetical protein
MGERDTQGLWRRQSLVAPRGHIDGLILSNDTDTEHDIALSNGEATIVDANNSAVRVLAELDTTLVKKLDLDWTAGTGGGGIAPGARTVQDVMDIDEWYHYFIIGTPGGEIDAGVDTSTTAANLLAEATDFGFYRRVGSVLSDGSSNVTQFTQIGDKFLWNTPAIDHSGVAANYTTQTTITLDLVPTGYVSTALLRAAADDQDVEEPLVIRPLTETNVNPSKDAAPLGTLFAESAATTTGGHYEVDVNTSAQIAVKQVTDGSINLYIVVLGWIDQRGRNA